MRCQLSPILALGLQVWDNLRPECAEQLRQPLCLALLRNCTSPYDEVNGRETPFGTFTDTQRCTSHSAETLELPCRPP